MTIEVDVSAVPADVGLSRTILIPAVKATQGRRSFYNLTLSLLELVEAVELPDPEKPLADNRRVQKSRARSFAVDYLLGNADDYVWVCPPVMVRAEPGEITVHSTIKEFDNGTSWVLLEITRALVWAILDGQHRTLGFKLAFDELRESIRKSRALVNAERKDGATPEVLHKLESALAQNQRKMDELSQSHVAVTLVEAPSEVGRQMFVDIARNAKGVNPDFTVILDERSVVNRIAVDLAAQHPLLQGRVESGQSSRITAKSKELIGAKTVADIVRSVIVGTGRVGKRVEHEVARSEDGYRKQVAEFLDSLVASFGDLQDVMGGRVAAPELRKESLLGSGTMLRVLAIVWHKLRKGDPENGISPMAVGAIETYFKELDPYMRPFTDVETRDRVTGEVKVQYGMPLEDPLWMPTRSFLPGSRAPQARQGTIKSLSEEMADWARNGLPENAKNE